MTGQHFFVLSATVCGALASTSLPGCQYFYEFKVRGTIRDSADGSPLVGVRIYAKGFDLPSPGIADTRGAFTIRFDVSDGDFIGEEDAQMVALSHEGRLYGRGHRHQPDRRAQIRCSADSHRRRGLHESKGLAGSSIGR